MRPPPARSVLLSAVAAVVFAQPAARPSFEVASIKTLADIPFNVPDTRSGGLLRRSTTLMGLILYAYHLQAYQVSGVPKSPVFWFTIDARTDPAASEDQVRLMFQTLLAERFHLAAHRETRELPGYALAVAGRGPKIKPASAGDPPPMPEYFKGKPPDTFDGRILISKEGDLEALTGRRVTMAQLAEILGNNELHAFVIDRTGLPGEYYFGFKFASANSRRDADGPTIFAGLQEELGLRLEKDKGPVEMLIIDQVDTAPTGN